MIIAVNTTTLPGEEPEGYSYFIAETFKRIVKSHPGHQFIFIFDHSFPRDLISGPNVRMMISSPKNKHPLLWKLWYDVKLPVLLKKYKADLCFSTGGRCSLTAKLPQGLLLHDLSFLQNLSSKGNSRKQLGKSLQKAGSVAVLSELAKTAIIKEFAIESSKIETVPVAPGDIFQPLAHAEKESTRQRYTDGKEYFLYTGIIHPGKNIMGLLKAFSVFKKKQQSGIKLVLAAGVSRDYRSFTGDLATYRYRDDVLLTGALSEKERARLMGAAYALIYPSQPEGFAMPVLEAMRSQVPVIATEDSLIKEITKGAALSDGVSDFNGIAGAMIRLYKDETLRKELINKGSTVVKEHSWENTTNRLWHSILKAIG